MLIAQVGRYESETRTSLVIHPGHGLVWFLMGFDVTFGKHN